MIVIAKLQCACVQLPRDSHSAVMSDGIFAKDAPFKGKNPGRRVNCKFQALFLCYTFPCSCLQILALLAYRLKLYLLNCVISAFQLNVEVEYFEKQTNFLSHLFQYYARSETVGRNFHSHFEWKVWVALIGSTYTTTLSFL